RRAVEGHATETGDSRAAVLVRLVAIPPGDQGLHHALRRNPTMQDRRTFLGLAAAAALLPIDLDAQTPAAAPRPSTELARHALTGPLEGFEAVLTQVTAQAGQPGAAAQGQGHRHSGFVLGYVLEG